MDDTERSHLGIRSGLVFRPSAPVDEKELFSGRSNQLRRVIDAIFHPGQNVVIFGERGVGKTSLVNVLAGFLPNPEQRRFFARVNCNVADKFDSLWRRAFSEFPIPQSENIPGFTDRTRVTTTTMADQLPKKVTPDVVFKFFKWVNQVGRLLIIFDEFDRLQDPSAIQQFADIIKALSDFPTSTTLIIVGVGDSIDDLIKGHQSVGRSLVQISLPRMSNEELTGIIDKGLLSLGMTMDEQIKHLIVSISLGLPHYTHLLCLHSARVAIDDDQKHIAAKHFSTAMAGAINDAQHSIRTAYSKAVTSQRQGSIYPQVLLACAQSRRDDSGFFSAGSIRGPLSAIMKKQYDIPAYARHLNDFSTLLRGPILQKAGQRRRYRFRFKDPLMQPFVVMKGIESGALSMGQAIDLINAAVPN